jgi:hypothetical protein
MPHAKNIFSCATLDTRDIGSPALGYDIQTGDGQTITHQAL